MLVSKVSTLSLLWIWIQMKVNLYCCEIWIHVTVTPLFLIFPFNKYSDTLDCFLGVFWVLVLASTCFVFSPVLSLSVSPPPYFLSSSPQWSTAEVRANLQNVCVCWKLCQPELAELQFQRSLRFLSLCRRGEHQQPISFFKFFFIVRITRTQRGRRTTRAFIYWLNLESCSQMWLQHSLSQNAPLLQNFPKHTPAGSDVL